MTSNTDHVEPLRTARILSLLMAWATATVSGCLGLYALIKTNQIETKLRHTAFPAVLSFNDRSMFIAGLVLTIGTTILATMISNFLNLFFLPFLRKGPIPLSTRTLTFQKFFLLFMAIWLLANQIAYSAIFATGEVVTVAKLGPLILPPALVQASADAMGVKSIYRQIYYLRWSEIFNWFTVLFAWIVTLITFKAASQAKSITAGTTRSSEESANTIENEKAEVVMTENAAPATAETSPATEV